MNARAIVDEAVDPKRVLQGIRHAENSKLLGRDDSVTIVGRRWFRRGYGGTYHAATIYVNGQQLVTTPRQYGYGDQYMETAWQWLEDNGYVPRRERSANGGMGVPWREAQELGILLDYRVLDVKRQRDL